METEPKIIESYVRTGKVKLVYRHLLQHGEGSVIASEANECAGEQGKYWEMRNVLYRNQYQGRQMADLAAELEMDVPAFEQCMQEHRYKAAVEADYADVQRRGIVGRPVFEINGARLVGAQGLARFESIIEDQLK